MNKNSKVGQKLFIRSVTHHYTGLCVRVTKRAIVLTHAAWIADDGRFSDAMQRGTLSEVEPYRAETEVSVYHSAILDVSVWAHELPSEQK